MATTRPACAQTRRPVPGSGSHLNEGAEAGEGCQGAIVGKDVRIALCEVGEAIGSDVAEQFVEPVVIHAAHRPPFDSCQTPPGYGFRRAAMRPAQVPQVASPLTVTCSAPPVPVCVSTAWFQMTWPLPSV